MVSHSGEQVPGSQVHERLAEGDSDGAGSRSRSRTQRELAYKDRQKLNTERKELLAILDGWTEKLHEDWSGLATRRSG